jgi:hypothetical protein
MPTATWRSLIQGSAAAGLRTSTPLERPRRADIDLPNIAFGVQTTLAYAENSTDTGGTLTVRDGRHTATLALLGNYVAGSFTRGDAGYGSPAIRPTATVDTSAAALSPHSPDDALSFGTDGAIQI